MFCPCIPCFHPCAKFDVNAFQEVLMPVISAEKALLMDDVKYFHPPPDVNALKIATAMVLIRNPIAFTIFVTMAFTMVNISLAIAAGTCAMLEVPMVAMATTICATQCATSTAVSGA